MSLGNRIKMLRTSENLTQEEAAASLGVNRSSYANWEINRNSPRPEDLQNQEKGNKLHVSYRQNSPQALLPGGCFSIK